AAGAVGGGAPADAQLPGSRADDRARLWVGRARARRAGGLSGAGHRRRRGARAALAALGTDGRDGRGRVHGGVSRAAGRAPASPDIRARAVPEVARRRRLAAHQLPPPRAPGPVSGAHRAGGPAGSA
ncbi:hypothetical protein H632_c5597p0, partial [Helicosporidium sp. ATCC 50920]